MTGEAFGHDIEACRQVLIDGALANPEGPVEVIASTEPPLFDSGYEAAAFTCPHGTTFYLEPTREQILAWQRDGVR